jgi:SWI/SNF-related matrix-associated actin-dependent regulator 1 of chromatin subfamily A
MLRDDVNLYPYQNIGSAFIKERRYVLIGDEMGLGKTLQAIVAMEGLNQILVVCPAMLRVTWENEVKKFSTMSVGKITGKNFDYAKTPKVVVVSYEGLKNIPTDLNPDMVVFDECHYLKNPKAARTKEAHHFIWEVRPPFCVGLSGTPIRNNVGEFYSILKLLSYNPVSSNGIPLAERSQYAFSLKFSQPVTRTISVAPKKAGDRKRTIEITEFKGLRNKEMLKKYLHKKYIRRTSKTVLDLPPLSAKTINLTDRDSITSKQLLVEWNSWVKEGKMGTHTTQLKVAAAMEKVPHTCKYLINMVEQGESVVMFSDHVDPITAIAANLNKAGIECGTITGVVTQNKRQEAIQEFQEGRLKVLCCSIKAASTGLTLTRARHLVFNDLSWVPADLEQARKRIHRIGQEHACLIHHMTMGEVDANIQEKIIEKSKLMREIL